MSNTSQLDPCPFCGSIPVLMAYPGGHGAIPGYNHAATPRELFADVWQGVYGGLAWAENPWVWVIEFKRVD